MAILIDLIVIGILLLSTFLGYKKGLIGVVFKIVSTLIAIVIALILFKPVSGYIMNNTQFAQNIETTIVEKLATENIESGKIKEEDSQLPSVIVDYINEEVTKNVNDARNTVVEVIAKNLAKTAIELIVIVGIFIAVRILLIFAKVILQAIAELPIIKQFNEVGGILYGLLRGALLIYVVLAIVSLILPMLDKGAVLGAINETILTKMLYNNNLILMLFF